MYSPPFALRVWPVMKFAPGPAKNATNLATSSGTARRPIGLAAPRAAMFSALKKLVAMGVAMNDGTTVLTQMLLLAYSSAQQRVKPMSAALLPA